MTFPNFGQPQPTQPQPQGFQPPPPPPAFNPAGLPPQQPSAPSTPSVDERLASLEASHKDVRNQVAELTGAVNGLGQNTEALHQWVVGTMENVVGMVGSIVQQVQQEGVLKLFTGMFGGSGQAQQGQPQPPQPPQQ